MRQTRFARGCSAVSVALPLCLLSWSDQIDGLFGVVPLAFFVVISATVYFASGVPFRGRARRRTRPPVRPVRRAA